MEISRRQFRWAISQKGVKWYGPLAFQLGENNQLFHLISFALSGRSSRGPSEVLLMAIEEKGLALFAESKRRNAEL